MKVALADVSLMSVRRFHELFNSQADAYSSFRPKYSSGLFDTICSYAGIRPQQKGQLAVDIATGSGQAVEGLSQRFERVIGLDANQNQLSRATPVRNAEYRIGVAEATGLPGSCADLVTVAQALHWFDLPRFYAEAARILKPSGSLAAWTYDVCSIDGSDSDATQVLHAFYNGSSEGQLGPYWSARRALITQRYAGLEPPSCTFAHSERHELSMTTSCSLAQLLGYLASWSAYATYCSQHADRPDPLEHLQQQLMHTLGAADLEHTVLVEWPLTLLLAKGPNKAGVSTYPSRA